MRKLFFTLLLVMALAVSTPAGVVVSDYVPPDNPCLSDPPPDLDCDTHTTEESEPGIIQMPGFTTIMILTILDLVH